MTIYNLKPAFQNLLRPIVRYLVNLGITANFVTLFTTILSVLIGLLIYFNIDNKTFFLILPIFLFIRMALNAIDGMIAREHNMKTNLGIFLNEIGDAISDSALYLPFCLISEISSEIVIFIIIASIISEMVGIISIQIDGKRHYEGPMGKSDRAFVFGLLAIIYAVFDYYFVTIILNFVLGITAIMLILTIFNRINLTLKSN